jgi:hypothetical protein
MESHPNELAIPPEAMSDPQARELLRVWGARGSLNITLAAETWDDPAAWGIALVDLARHVARAFEQRGSLNVDGALARLRQGFDAEWDSPTDAPTGAMG